MLRNFVIPIFICIFSISSATGEDLVNLRFKLIFIPFFFTFLQLLSVRQADDVVVHLPSNSNNSTRMPSYMVIALHGMGPNYPDLFQQEVMMNSVLSFQLILR